MPLRCPARCRIALSMLVLGATLAISAGGCSKAPEQHEVFPVKGQLFLDKKPAAGAVVWLHSVELLNRADDPKALAAEPRPRGVVGEDGTFEISTYGNGDGAPVGRYRLAIFWTKPGALGDDAAESLLPPRYQDPRNSELPVIEVKREPNVIPPLYLTP